MMNEMKCGAQVVPKTGEIPVVFDRLNDAVGQLRKSVYEIGEAIEPAMTPEHPTEPMKECETMYGCSVAESMGSVAREVEVLRNRLDYYISRIQL